MTVSELECTEIGCPPIETVVTVYAPGQDPFSIKVPKPIAEMERFDLLAALAFGGDHS